jgi:hypothetical protein
VTETSRLSSTAAALGQALEALADALAQARHESMAACEATIEATAHEFRQAAVEAVATGEALTPEQMHILTAALARCRRLGVSLSLLTGQPVPDSETSRGYTPVGRPLPGGGATLLTARG